jgi:hypothetical protein
MPAPLSEVAPPNQSTSLPDPADLIKQRSGQEADPPLHITPSILSRLPLECWLQVLDYLSQSDLLKVCRVSKELHASALPTLYRILDWDWCTGPDQELPFLQLIKLLRTIHERPEISALIHHVSFVANNTTTRDPIDEQYTNSNHSATQKILRNHPTVKNFTLSIIRLAKFPRQDFWKKALNEGNPYAYAALLISQMSSLQTLELDCTFIYYDGFPGLMMTHAMLGSPPGVMSDFAWLDTVDYGKNCAWLRLKTATGVQILTHATLNGCETRQFVGWFFLPALRDLDMWVRSPCLAADIGEGTTIQPSNLARLHVFSLIQASPNTEDMNTLLPQMKSLNHLLLTPQYATCLEQLESVAGMAPGLSALSGTLKRLFIGPVYTSLQPQTDGAYAGDQVGLKLPRGIIKTFEKLTFLNLPLPTFLGWGAHQQRLSEALPTSLKALVLRDYLLGTLIPHRWPNEIFHVLGSFLQNEVHHFPRLT